MVKILLIAGVLAWPSFIAVAEAGTPVGGYRGAPAPLLAAGLPAFVALGGGAALARLLRRGRGDSRD
ncbi:MAG TPA: hypothetical protein VMI52_06760 [Acetobacteraceae bacterium]|nr:hypothetical protein [Acetobacteraceae bacterium]